MLLTRPSPNEEREDFIVPTRKQGIFAVSKVFRSTAYTTITPKNIESENSHSSIFAKRESSSEEIISRLIKLNSEGGYKLSVS